MKVDNFEKFIFYETKCKDYIPSMVELFHKYQYSEIPETEVPSFFKKDKYLNTYYSIIKKYRIYRFEKRKTYQLYQRHIKNMQYITDYFNSNRILYKKNFVNRTCVDSNDYEVWCIEKYYIEMITINKKIKIDFFQYIFVYEDDFDYTEETILVEANPTKNIYNYYYNDYIKYMHNIDKAIRIKFDPILVEIRQKFNKNFIKVKEEI